MRSTFFGLNVAVRGLYAAQRNLDVVNHNLNNVNTPGYSRQRAVQAASTPMSAYDGRGMIGTGSEVSTIQRVRDEYLDFKYWSENVSQSEWDTKKELLADLEVTFNEPSDSGFTTISNEFFNALQEIAKDPGSAAARSIVREKGVTLAKYFNSTAAHFEKLQSDVNYRVKTTVEEINSIGNQIQQLNRQIYTTELDGNAANDLRDQRTVLVDKLSGLINIETYEVVAGQLPNGKDDKHFVIAISGKAFVDHFNLSRLKVEQRDTKLNPEDVDNLYDIKWADENGLKVKGGELRAYLDIRDGNEGDNKSPLYKGIPYYNKKLNEFVRTFAKAFNEGYIDSNADKVIDSSEDGSGHADGYGVDPDGDGLETAVKGIRFFTLLGADGKPVSSSELINGADGVADDIATSENETIKAIDVMYDKITAKNFTVSSDIIDDYTLIAASDKLGEEGNIVNLNAILTMRREGHMFAEGAPEDFMKSLVTNLGIDSQQAVRMSDNQTVIVQQIENRRLSDSGVSIDEEMANLVKFQHAYSASAKMISTMSEIYDTLINRLGVG